MDFLEIKLESCQRTPENVYFSKSLELICSTKLEILEIYGIYILAFLAQFQNLIRKNNLT